MRNHRVRARDSGPASPGREGRNSGKQLPIRRDRTVVYGGVEIGWVYPDPVASQIHRDWYYEHASGTTFSAACTRTARGIGRCRPSW